jgi:hypothetical protein
MVMTSMPGAGMASDSRRVTNLPLAHSWTDTISQLRPPLGGHDRPHCGSLITTMHRNYVSRDVKVSEL